MQILRTEDIYYCLDDDAAFAHLPGLVAKAVGARSAVFHWRSMDDSPLVLADSGYWSAAQMAEYVACYAEHDIWAQSTLTARTQNRLWVIDDLVPDRVYSNSVFYNEWIRTMGDDTYHCIGMSMAGPSGTGLIGLHRAKSSGAFEADAMATLNGHIGPIQRLMRVRGMLAEARANSQLLGDALDRLALDVLIVGRDHRLLHANVSAHTLLRSGVPLSVRDGKVGAAAATANRKIAAAIARATCPTKPEATFTDILSADGRSIQMTVAPVQHRRRRCAMVILRASPSAAMTSHLQRMFGLTASEAAVAVALTEGSSPGAIAAGRSVSILTVRTQIKVIAEKLGSRRQAEIVALLARVEAMLPHGTA